MSAPSKFKLSALAENVRARVAADELAKTAALTHTSKDVLTSSVAQLLSKTAQAVREEAEFSQITYEDVAEFRKKHDV